LLQFSALTGVFPWLSAFGGAAPRPAPALDPALPPAPAPLGATPPVPYLPTPSPGVVVGAPRPSWADAVPVDHWYEFPGTAFEPWAIANVPAGAYRGSGLPFRSMVNAYCDPAHDALNGAQFFYGGGHGDGTCNAVAKFSHQSLSWSLEGKPTPPSIYLPGYNRNIDHPDYQNPVTYPSGKLAIGWFLPADQLPDPRDAAHRAPELARRSTHMYAAAAMRGSVVHYFYLTYAEFDSATKSWVKESQNVDLGYLLEDKFGALYGNSTLAQGTVAIYDEVTDRFFVTLNPGDGADVGRIGGFRSAIMVFNPTTRQVESVHGTSAGTFGLILNSVNICRVGRNLYVFTKIGNYGQPQVMNQGFVFNFDSKVFGKFVVAGDTDGSTYPDSQTQETIPSWYDGVAIRRWNYASAFTGKIYSVNPIPESGAGTISNPWVLRQTVRTIAGSAPTLPQKIYKRMVFHAGAGCALVLPNGTSNWMALRLS
jgi:hypothetical protein